MKILVAPDKFKGSLSAMAVCNAIETGIKNVMPDSEIIKVPLADGGEGSLDILEKKLNIKRIYLDVKNPIFNIIQTYYGVSKNAAYIEMASASGLQLLQTSERRAMLTTSFGTGEMILDALTKGARKIYLFVGGSATNDAGIGMAAALGYKFLDSRGRVLEPIGANLINISEIDSSNAKSFDGVELNILTDVDNVFDGPEGAAYVYAKQKGANKSEIRILDGGLKNISKVWLEKFGLNVSEIKGSGAAGGLGGGAIVFCNGKIKSGIKTIFDLIEFEKLTEKTELVITGEGLIDEQTLKGKVVKGVSEICTKANIPIGILCGDLALSKAKQRLLNAVFIEPIKTDDISKEEAMQNAYNYLVSLASKSIQKFI